MPILYCRYIDNFFVVTDSKEDVETLRQLFGENSVLKFTVEENVQKSINFLDIHVNYKSWIYETSVYVKPTNGSCSTNGNSECPDQQF